MRSIEGILKEELIRLRIVEKSYISEINKLPLGSIQEKKIKGKRYPYIVRSKNSKIKYRYIGNLPVSEIQRLKKAIAQRKRYQLLLKDVRKNMKRLERILCARRKTV